MIAIRRIVLLEALEHDTEYYQTEPTTPSSAPFEEELEHELEVRFPPFSREIHTFERNVQSQKIF